MEEITLDTLFKEVRKAGHKERAEKEKKLKAAPAIIEPPQTVWTNPENWKKISTVTVLVRKTNCVVGNFSKYLHKKVEGCVKLVREANEETSTGVEYIEDCLTQDEPPKLHKHIKCIVNLHLAVLGVATERLEIEAHFAYGKLAAVRLLDEKCFYLSAGGFLTLSAGCDVFPVLSPACVAEIQEHFQ